jgi:adenylate kinase
MKKTTSTAKNLIFIGAQGAGKGTYAAIVKTKYDIHHISTGDMFRENIKNNTPLGIEAKGYIDQGKLVPDDLTVRLVKDRLERPDCKNGFILDGFPRTLSQAEKLDGITKITNVILLEVKESVVMQRIGGRIQCRKCGAIFHKTNMPPKKDGVCDKCGGELYTRDDDKPEAIKKRLEIFYKDTFPLVDFYEKNNLVSRIDANDSKPRNVADAIIKVLGN